MANKSLKPNTIRATLAADRPLAIRSLSDSDLERMERQLIPLLNTVRAMRGKEPIIVPGQRRAKAS